jgi:peroxiredoxin
MVGTLCLCCCVLTTAQPADRSEWLLTPRLGRAQELVYRGTFSEESLGSAVQFNRTYRFESRVLVLETPPTGAEVAFLTVLKVRTPETPGGRSGADASSVYSVRLELGQVDLQGRVKGDGAGTLALALDGPPLVECGAFVEAPRQRVAVDQSWEVNDDGRPLRTWKVLGAELLNGANCVKLLGQQQSDDWDRPRADRTAWRRLDTVWVSPRQGVACRVERIIERRDPARQEPSTRLVLRYELESSLQYPGQLIIDRRREIVQARAFAETAAPLLPAPARFVPQLEALLTKINHHLETTPPTPYREAVLQVKRRVEAARRGETPPVVVVSEQRPAVVASATVGQPAPDFVAPDFLSRESVRPRQWQGRPVLMVFYSPTSRTAEELLNFARTIYTSHRGQAAVVALAMSDDAERVRKQHAEFQLPFPVLNGTGLRISYGVEATPRLVVLDVDGVVRGTYLGWGAESSAEVERELKRWLPKK